MTQWRVAGNHAVLGVDPGGTIEQDIPPAQAAALLFGGHIVEAAPEARPETSEEQAPDPAADMKEASE